MVAHDLMRLLERHGEFGRFRLGCRFKSTNGQVIGFNPPTGRGESPQTRGVPRPQARLFHHLLGVSRHNCRHLRIVLCVLAQLLVQLPQQTVQGQRRVVAQKLFGLTHLDLHLSQMRRQQKRRGIGPDMGDGERLCRQQFTKLGFARLRQGPGKVFALQIRQTRGIRKLLPHRQRHRKRAPQAMHHCCLQRGR